MSSDLSNGGFQWAGRARRAETADAARGLLHERSCWRRGGFRVAVIPPMVHLFALTERLAIGRVGSGLLP